FSNSEGRLLPVAKVSIGFLDNGVAAAKVRHDAEIEIFGHSALNDGSNSPHRKRTRVELIRADEETSIGLNVASNSKLKIVVGRSDRKAIPCGIDRSRGRRLCSQGFLIQFTMP